MKRQHTIWESLFLGILAVAVLFSWTAVTAHAQPKDEYDISVEELQRDLIVTTGDAAQDAVTDKKQEKFVTTTEMVNESESDSNGRASDLDRLITNLMIFGLATFVGFAVVSKVPPTLHMRLLTGSAAIGGITVVGAILAGVVGSASGREILAGALAFAAALFAMINVTGGFVLTGRVLRTVGKEDRA
jgi:H+-translocating NAD(P) transhydrogenase subunit alpha